MGKYNSDEFDLQYLKGIGPKRAQILSGNGIKSFHDLINYFPRKYVDRSTIVSLDKLQPDQEVTVIGKIEVAGIRRMRKAVFYLVISDGKGIMEAIWFNSVSFFKNLFKVGEWISLSGKPSFYRGYQMVHPDYDRLGDGEIDNLFNTGKILPFYPENETFKKVGINSYTFRKIFFHLFQTVTDEIQEILPEILIKKRGFQNLDEAYRQIHNPDNQQKLDLSIYRFKYEEFFYQQLMMALQKANLKSKPVGIAFMAKSERLEQLYKSLPFTMTEAQKRVVREIREDMKNPAPMNRLLQGDVGSGKTLVAIMAMLIAIDNGYQAALMVPTEILAEQHFINISKLLNPLNVKVSLLTGSTPARQRKQLQENLESSDPHIVIGTHAIIQDAVEFKQLGLVVIDEQHRFGVMQRGSLMSKGTHPDVLVMTATPIPRTLALTAYGSLDVSVIDEMPADRKDILTVWRFDDKANQIYEFIRERLKEGEQAYIVYPLVEESEKLDLKAATESFEYLRNGPFAGFKLELLHGRMKSAEKERVMQLFVDKKVDILVSTTVIEVGVDVANATVMLVEHGERFGLSQLHQLRGRVGRSDKKSYCILKTPHNIGEVALQRMRIMTETQNGFVIAEKDLELRGWGDFFGTKQSGMPDFRLANPIIDLDILKQARQDAFELVNADNLLRKPENKELNQVMRTRFKEKMDLINIS
ncbi:MAG: ATP-dependent DNA helicase RecG [Calditrichaceae bacterium]